MKKLFALMFLCVVMVGCRGKSGKDGAGGGEMQNLTGTITADDFTIQVDEFGDLDEVTVYYSLSSASNEYFEMKGPIAPSDTAPYYSYSISGSGILVRFFNVPVGSLYRILIWRPSGLL